MDAVRTAWPDIVDAFLFRRGPTPAKKKAKKKASKKAAGEVGARAKAGE
jgi:hypothetical protein